MSTITVREDIMEVLVTTTVNMVNPSVESNDSTSGAIVISGGGGLGISDELMMGGNIGIELQSNLEGIVTIGVSPTEYSLPAAVGGDLEYLQQNANGELVFIDPRSGTSVNYDTVTVTPGDGSLIKSLDTQRTSGVSTSNVSVSGDITGVSSLDVADTTGVSTIGGILKAGSGTSSSSSTNGAMKVTGGTGISGELNVGDISSIQGNSSIDGVFTTGVTGQQYSFPTTNGLLNQVVTITSTINGTLGFVTPVIDNSDDVIAPTPFGVDNLLIRTTGSGRDVESTGVVLDETNDMSGVNTLSVSGDNTIGGVVIGSSLQVTGGVGIAENMNITGSVTNTGIITVSSTVVSSNSTDGALVVNGGMGVGGDVHVGGTLNANSIDFTDTELSILISTPSTSAGTGALTVVGGSVIGGDLTVGASGDIIGSVSVGDVIISDTTESTSVGTGALTTLGGIGVGQSVHVDGIVFARDVTNGSMVVGGGVGITKDVFMNTAPTDTTIIGGVTTLLKDENAVSTDTGTLVVSGGVGIVEDVYVGGTVFVSGVVEEGDKFIHLIHTNTINTSNTTPVPLPWDTTVRKDSVLYTHTPGSTGITILESGWYDITLDVNTRLLEGSGDFRTVSSVILTNGGIEIPNTSGFMYNRVEARSYGQATVQILTQLTAGDIIDARIYRLVTQDTGSTVRSVSNACRILIEKV
jgi:hypothetical protein